jgi:hypothetical protein
LICFELPWNLIKRETVWKLFSCDDVLSFSLVMSKNYSHCDIQSYKIKGKYWVEGKYHRITIRTVWPNNDSNSLTHSWITALFVYPWFIFNIRNARIFIPYLFGCRVNHFKEVRKKPNIRYVFVSNGWKVRFLFSWVPPWVLKSTTNALFYITSIPVDCVYAKEHSLTPVSQIARDKQKSWTILSHKFLEEIENNIL